MCFQLGTELKLTSATQVDRCSGTPAIRERQVFPPQEEKCFARLFVRVNGNNGAHCKAHPQPWKVTPPAPLSFSCPWFAQPATSQLPLVGQK